MSRESKKALILKLLAKNDYISLDVFMQDVKVSKKLLQECIVIDQINKLFNS